jgi:hypothetical protein
MTQPFKTFGRNRWSKCNREFRVHWQASKIPLRYDPKTIRCHYNQSILTHNVALLWLKHGQTSAAKLDTAELYNSLSVAVIQLERDNFVGKLGWGMLFQKQVRVVLLKVRVLCERCFWLSHQLSCKVKKYLFAHVSYIISGSQTLCAVFVFW